jgi:RNA ligase partner protein
LKKIYILDTSVFVNPACAHLFGSSPTDAFVSFLRQIEKLDAFEWLMPPNIYTELMHFADEKLIPKNLLTLVQQRPPKKHEIKVSGMFLYTLVDEMRDRSDRGLRLAERHVREAFQAPAPNAPSPAPGGKPIRPDAEAIGRLRESYRRMLREGMLDSKADVDLLLLAYETSGTLVSADQGVMHWANEMGVSILPAEQLPDLLKS